MREKNVPEDLLEKTIAGEITLSENPGGALKKWRQILDVSQKDLANALNISPSVISDYEAGRRSPGVEFVRKYTQALVAQDKRKKGGITGKIPATEKSGAILDMREFINPLTGREFIKHVNGKVMACEELLEEKIYGYTVIDSIKAILELSDTEFPQIYGINNQRAIIFTKVHLGRSPMIAIKVTKPKPAIVIFHGVLPGEVDKLAVKIAESERIPLVVSKTGNEEKLVSDLKEIEA
ncbi:MAG: helix-turn-helix domain-containing protein [Candidatus Altiarchaeia archaeon]